MKGREKVYVKTSEIIPIYKGKCDKNDCFVCLSDGKGNCRKGNVNYEIECTREGCGYVYYGESARNSYCRGIEHLKGIEKRDSNSVFVEHVRDRHGSDFTSDICSGFRMSVKETHKTALERQITEAVKIDSTNKQILNRKTGYRCNAVLTLGCSLTSDNNTFAAP